MPDLDKLGSVCAFETARATALAQPRFLACGLGRARLQHLRNIVRTITETGPRVYKELMTMKKDQ